MLPHPFTAGFLNRLEYLRLRTRREFLGARQGSYLSPRRGTSLEFADYRRYSPGDDLRYLDWGIYARSDRLYVKVFREEVDLFVYLFVDASGSMGFPSRERKFAPACHLALALAYIVLANHDRVKLHGLKEPVPPASPFYRGRHRIMDVAAHLSSFVPEGTLDLAPALGAHLKHLRRPGKAMVVSDFLLPVSAYERGLNLLRACNLDIAVIQVLSPEELKPPFPPGGIALVDSESGEERSTFWSADQMRGYRARLERHNRELKSFCAQAGIHYALYVTDRDLADFIFATLPGMGLFK